MNERVARAKDQGGFTLIELMIVIVILGILAGVVIFSVNGITDRGTTAACKTDLKTVAVAVEAFNAKTGGYPGTLDPALTTTPNQFLRAQPVDADGFGLGATTLTQRGYTITYDPGTGEVTADNC
jgi:prepilin-type N-terminal cleavage/methylation domain-containing protein